MRVESRTLRAAGIVLLVGCLAGLVQAQDQNFDNVQIQTVPVSGSVYMLVGSGGNIGVSAGDDGVFLVDDQYAPLHPKIIAAVKGISSRPIEFLLNTHWHWDHTGGNELIGRAWPISAVPISTAWSISEQPSSTAWPISAVPSSMTEPNSAE